MIYRGHLIERAYPSGYYTAFAIGHGNLVADTLEGIRRIIREAI